MAKNGSRTKSQARKTLKAKKPGYKIVKVNKANIRKYGAGITKPANKVGYGKKKQPTVSGKVAAKIKYLAAVPKPAKKKKPVKGRDKRKKKPVKSRALL